MVWYWSQPRPQPQWSEVKLSLVGCRALRCALPIDLPHFEDRSFNSLDFRIFFLQIVGFERTDMSAFLFSNFFRHALGIGVTSSGFWVQNGGFLLGIPYANGFEIPLERNPHGEQKYFAADKIPPLPNEPLWGHSGPSPTVVLATPTFHRVPVTQ